jgi:hypothetical protein
MKTKSILASKTVWVNLISAASTLYPPVGVWVAANPQVAMAVLGGINILVRLITKGAVSLFPADDAGKVGSGNGLGGSLLRLLMIMFTAAALVGLPSCSVSTAPDGTVTRKPDAESISLAQGLAAWVVGIWQVKEAQDAAAEERKEERRAAKVVVIPSK